MVTNEQKWAELIGKSLSGNISDEELSQLEAWRRETRENEEFYEEMISVWQITDPVTPELQPNIGLKWRELEKKLASQDRDQRVRVRGLYRWVAAAAAVVLLVLVFLPKDRLPFRSGSQPVFASADSVSGAREVLLPDGSRVWVRPGSEISWVPEFEVRNVTLTGEAFFEVRSNPDAPFSVSVAGATAKVLGTRFNLRSSETGEVELTVVEGRVEFGSRDEEKDKVVVVKEERYLMRPGTRELVKLPGVISNVTSWRSGTLSFEDVPFASVIEDLERHYGVEFEVSDSSLMDCELRAEFRERPLGEVISTIEFMMNWEISAVGDRVYSISGEPCKTE